MKRLIFFLMPALVHLTVNAQSYTAIDDGSKVKFVIKNFGINTGGVFHGLKGEIKFDKNNLSATEFNVSVDAKTIDTDIEARDIHIRKEEYLGIEKFPLITFISTSVTKTNTEGWLYIFGKITIKGTTKTVKFPFKISEMKDGILFEGEFSVDRRDFKVGGKSISLSNNLIVVLSVFAREN